MRPGRYEARDVLADDNREQERVRRAVHSREEQVAAGTRERRQTLDEALDVRHVLHHFARDHRVELNALRQRGGGGGRALAGRTLEAAQVRLDRLAAELDFAAATRSQNCVSGGVFARDAHCLLDDLQADDVGAYYSEYSYRTDGYVRAKIIPKTRDMVIGKVSNIKTREIRYIKQEKN